MTIDQYGVAPATFKNRRGGLLFFGVALMILGALAGLMGAFMLVGFWFSSEALDAAQRRMMLPSVIFYFLAGAYLVVLGVGSMRMKRWSRAMILATSWLWLVTGLVGILVFVFVVSPMLSETLPAGHAGVQSAIVGCMSVFFVLFGLVLPLSFLLFYRSRHVRLTVESLDPVSRWTDRVPLPVLAFAILWFYGGICSLIWPLSYRALPLGPWIIRGTALLVIMMIGAAAGFFVGLGSVRLWRAAWWTALVLMSVGAVLSFVLVPNADFEQWYEEMGIPADPVQIEMLESMYSSGWFLGMMALMWLIYFGWLLLMRRYFFPATSASAG